MSTEMFETIVKKDGTEFYYFNQYLNGKYIKPDMSQPNVQAAVKNIVYAIEQGKPTIHMIIHLISLVIAQVGIGKNGRDTSSGAGNRAYRSSEDVIPACMEAILGCPFPLQTQFSEMDLTHIPAIPNQDKSKPRAVVKIKYTITSVVDGSSITIIVSAEGMDARNGDKSSISASAYALREMFEHLFNIPYSPAEKIGIDKNGKQLSSDNDADIQTAFFEKVRKPSHKAMLMGMLKELYGEKDEYSDDEMTEFLVIIADDKIQAVNLIIRDNLSQEDATPFNDFCESKLEGRTLSLESNETDKLKMYNVLIEKTNISKVASDVY